MKSEWEVARQRKKEKRRRRRRRRRRRGVMVVSMPYAVEHLTVKQNE